VRGGDIDAVDLNVLAIEDEEAPDGLVVQVQPGDENFLGALDADEAGTAAELAWGS